MFEINCIRAQVLGGNTSPLADAQGNAQSGTCLTLEGGGVCDVTPSFCLGAQKYGFKVEFLFVLISFVLIFFFLDFTGQKEKKITTD